MTETESRDKCDNICVVCCRTLSISAIGECDHPVCYECATRMRVVCQQNECPICRRELPKVVFSEKRKQYADVATARYLHCDKKYQLYFENAKVQQAYYKLIEHVCPMCHERQVFETFDALSRHVRKLHDLNYCDICAKHLMIFTHERKCYNRRDLAMHKRFGDADDTSHRGHPLCEFCEERFLDNDELFRHLRREHFYCHFCDLDGLNHYYSDYEYLRKHFRVEHFLCEEGECLNEKFTTAFRSEIDLKAHKATVHNKGLTKAQAKQARTLELEFTIAPRSSTFSSDSASRFSADDVGRKDGESGKGNKSRPGNSYRGAGNYPQSNNSRYDASSPSEVRHKTQGIVQSPQLNMNSNQDFPVLGTDSKCKSIEPSSATNGSGPNSKTAINSQPTSGNSSNDTLAQKLARINRFSVGGNLTDAEFPALHTKETKAQSRPHISNSKVKGVNSWSAAGSAALSLTSSQLPSNSISKKTLTLKLNSHEDFPGLVRSPKKQQLAPNVSIQLSSKPHLNRDGSESLENESESKALNGYDGISNSRNSRDHPVVTRLEGSQNITFLNPPSSTKDAIQTNGTCMSISSDTINGNNNESKEGLSKTDSGWYVLKKGKTSKLSSYEQPEPAGSLAVPSLDEFPELQVKNGSSEKKETKLVVPINSCWKNSQDSKPAKVIESSCQPQKVAGKSKRKKKGNSNVNSNDFAKDGTLEPESEKANEPEACLVKNPKPTTSECDENFKSDMSTVKIKRSEMTVEGLSTSNASSAINKESVFSPEDFPRLSFTTMVKSYQTAPNLSTRDVKPARPPPGFSSPPNLTTTTKPPPGFEKSCVSEVQSLDCNRSPASPTSVTFTNSSGQNFTLPAAILHHSYYPPNDFQKRNQMLTLQLYNSLDEKDFSTFKEISGMFRQDIIPGADYYQQCIKLIGKVKFDKIFPELLILLPDISKQQELLSAYKAQKKKKSDSATVDFLVCASCRQVLTSSDSVAHENIHRLDADFPALGNPVETVHVSWVKQH